MKKRMKKAKKAKLLAALSITFLVLTFVITVLVELAIGHLQDASVAMTAYTNYLNGFGEASSYLTTEARFFAATGDTIHYDNYWTEVNTTQNREKNVAALQALGLTTEEQNVLNEISALSNGLVPLEEEAMNYAASGKTTAAIAIVYGDEYDAVVHQIETKIEELNDTVMVRAQHDVDKQANFVDIVSLTSCALLSITIVLMIVTVRLIMWDLLLPLLKMRDALVEFADGNLDSVVDMEVDSTEVGEAAQALKEFRRFQMEIIADIDDLLSSMANGNFDIKTACEENYKGSYANILVSLRKINRTLDATLKDIRLSAEQVDAGAEQVASGAQALSQGATEQASSTEELAATVNEINNHVQQSGAYANEASGKANEAGRLTAECNEEMKELVAAMDDISKTSEEISKIIKTIEDIAFQTNILALNAAVEAARAGTAGKGFAVVADEVRNLAAKSAEASQSTSNLIEASMAAVSRGVKLVDHTAENLQSVADHAQEVGDMVGQIAAASQEQAASIEQVTTGLDQIASVVQTNSATAEESAAASQELSSQAAMLKQLVERFKLRDDDTSAYRTRNTVAAPVYSEANEYDFSMSAGDFGSKY